MKGRRKSSTPCRDDRTAATESSSRFCSRRSIRRHDDAHMVWGGPRGCLHGVPRCLSRQARAFTQPPGGKGKDGKGGFGPGGFGPFGGQERKVVKDFDKNGDGWLNKEEREPARESLKNAGGFGGKGFGMKGGFGRRRTRPSPARRSTPADVKNYPNAIPLRPDRPAHPLPRVRERGLGSRNCRTSTTPTWTCPRR